MERERQLSPHPWLEVMLVALLLGLWWLGATGAAREKSATYDEPAHLVRGFVAWQTGDLRLSPPHPPLPQLWAAAPWWAAPAELPSLDEPSLRRSAVFTYGREFLYGGENDHLRLLNRSRAAMAWLGVLLGLLIHLWSRSLFGPVGGLLSLALYCATPAFMAHGALVTTDVPLSLALAATLASASWAYRRPGPLSVPIAVASFAAATLTKLVAWIALPLLLAWALLLVLSREPLRPGLGRRRELTGRGAKAALLAGLLALQLAGAWLGAWAVAGFQYDTFRLPPLPTDRMRSQSPDEAARDSWEGGYRDLPRLEAVLEPLRRSRLVPEFLLYSVVHGAQDSRRSRGWLDGEVLRGGTRSYFPKVVAYKTPPALALALLLAAAAGGAALLRRARAGGARAALRALLPAAPALLLAGGYGAMMLGSHVTLGERHLLPAWPPLLVLCGAGAAWLRRPSPVFKSLPLLAVGGLVLTTAVQWPHLISYFSPVAGGSPQGYRHLVDSSLDWGQDLPALARLLEQAPDGVPVSLAYFGSAVPEAHGVEGTRLPLSGGGHRPGLYAISFTHLQQVWLLGRTAWTADFEDELRALEGLEASGSLDRRDARRLGLLRFGRLCAWLRSREPDARAGWSIGLWALDAGELERALRGPLPAREPR